MPGNRSPGDQSVTGQVRDVWVSPNIDMVTKGVTGDNLQQLTPVCQEHT